MRIAVASGKGGAGKTSVAASLARVWNAPLILADADAEAPNIHLFLKTETGAPTPVTMAVPTGVTDACTACGACREICRHSAIARFGKKIAVFPDMCHGCGGCFAVCPENALKEGTRELGILEQGEIPAIGRFLSGTTRVGEVMTPPLLRALIRRLGSMEKKAPADAIIDCPPGVSCPAVTVARAADAILLVADPSPFGRHDFALAYAAFAALGKPLACVANRSGMPGNTGGDAALRARCTELGIPLLAELPFEREAAEAYARGAILADASDAWRSRFGVLADKVRTTFGLSAGRSGNQGACRG